MRRRSFLAVAGTGLLAGCTGDSDGSAATGTPTATPTPTPNPTPDPRLEDELDSAFEEFREATDLLEEEIDRSWAGTEDLSLSTAGTESALENAYEHLDAADEYATSRQQPVIEEARAYGSYVEEMLEVYTTLSAGFNHWSTAASYEEANRYEDAVSEIEEALDDFVEAGTLLESARETLEGIDEDTMGGDVDYAQAQETTEELSTIIDGYQALLGAGVPFDRGLSFYNDASDHHDEENWDHAAELYREAADYFEEAETLYEDNEDEAPQSLRSSFITQACYSEMNKEGARAYADGAEHAEAEEWSAAREDIDNGNSIMSETCE